MKLVIFLLQNFLKQNIQLFNIFIYTKVAILTHTNAEHLFLPLFSITYFNVKTIKIITYLKPFTKNVFLCELFHNSTVYFLIIHLYKNVFVITFSPFFASNFGEGL